MWKNSFVWKNIYWIRRQAHTCPGTHSQPFFDSAFCVSIFPRIFIDVFRDFFQRGASINVHPAIFPICGRGKSRRFRRQRRHRDRPIIEKRQTTVNHDKNDEKNHITRLWWIMQRVTWTCWWVSVWRFYISHHYVHYNFHCLQLFHIPIIGSFKFFNSFNVENHFSKCH